jgi:hypothetical protein
MMKELKSVKVSTIVNIYYYLNMTTKRFMVLLALGLLVLPGALAHREATDEEPSVTTTTQSTEKEYIEVPS